MGQSCWPIASLAAAKAAGAMTVNVGIFINTIITFLIIALAVFILGRNINKPYKKPEAHAATTTKDCPLCLMSIPIKATRCGHCTADLKKT